MHTLILNGIPSDDKYNAIEKKIEQEVLNNTTDRVEYFRLRGMNINYCTGCWSCWWKTPGYCSIKDDHEMILSRFPHVDKVVFVSPIMMGYESSILKKTKDRIIPTALPYIHIYKGEMHHVQRYSSQPDIEVHLITDEDTIDSEINNILHTYERIALNFTTKVTNLVTSPVGGKTYVTSSH